MMLLHSLRTRLLVTFSLVLIVAIGTVAQFGNTTTQQHFARYVDTANKADQLAVSKLLTSYQGDPGAVRVLVKNVAATTGQHILYVDSKGRVIADSEGKQVGQVLVAPPVAADPEPPGVFRWVLQIGSSMVRFGRSSSAKVATAQRTAATPTSTGAAKTLVVYAQEGEKAPVVAAEESGDVLRVDAAPGEIWLSPSLGPPPSGDQFITSVNRSLLLAGGLAGSLAVLLTVLLSSRILRPIHALTIAAGKMEQGDLSQRVVVRTKDELGALARAFNAMADSVARAEQLRRTMLGDVAHDLRTPLTNIRGYLEAVQDGVLRPTPEVIRSLQDEALLLTRLVSDLQELAQAEAGQLHLDCRPLDLAAALRQAAAVVAPQARAKGVQVDVQTPEALPPVLADAERVGQMLGNLLHNAIAYTPEGGHVTLSAVGGDPVEVRVADTGIGIAPEHLPNTFERFYRVDPSRNRATGGSGLGLAIVKHLVEQQGGRAWAESTVGTGSVFRFTLPPAPAGAAAREPALV